MGGGSRASERDNPALGDGDGARPHGVWNLLSSCSRTKKQHMPGEKGDRLLKLGIVGTILACLACFTPAAVVLLGFLGLARWAGYLDYVLFPLLGLFLILLAYGAWRRRQAGRDRTLR